MLIDLTLVDDMQGPQGIFDSIQEMKLTEDCEIEINGEVMTVAYFKENFPKWLAQEKEHQEDNGFEM